MKVTWKDILGAPAHWALQAVVRVAAILLGFLVVPVALLLVKLPEPWEKHWRYIGLPIWADPWDNVRDGAMGDKRMWWWLEGYPPWMDKLPPKLHSYIKAFWWLAIRNSANKISRYYPGIGCPVSKCKIEYVGDYFVKDKVGNEGFQFVKATGPTFTYWGLYHNIPIPRWLGWVGFLKGKAFIGRMGHKIEPRHALVDWQAEEESKRYKGWTFRPYLPQKIK